MLLALCISLASPLWFFFPPSIGPRKILVPWAMRGLVARCSVHIIYPTVVVKSKWLLPTGLSAWREREREGKRDRERYERGPLQHLGLDSQSRACTWLSQPRVPVKTVAAEETPHLTAHIHVSSALLSCLRNILDGITEQSPQWMPKWYPKDYTLVSIQNNDISQLIKVA